jgi:hypothetical protein
MAEATPRSPAGAPWSERLFDALPVAPIWVGAAMAAALLALFAALSAGFGAFSEFLADRRSFWSLRDARLGVVLVVLAAFVPTAERYAQLGARRNLDALEPVLGPDAFAPLRGRVLRGDPRRRRLAGLFGLLLAPTAALFIDRNPALYFQAGYWSVENAWSWVLSACFCFALGRFMNTTLEISHRFSALADELAVIDLFDPAPLAPFARQGLLLALLWLLLPSIFAANAMDPGFAFPIAILGLLCLAIATAGLLLPVLGVHRRLRDAKAAERARVLAAMRGEAGALSASPIAPRASTASLADLVAWQGFVDSASEWPYDAGMRLRFALYLAIPVGSWLGGALVERLLGAAFD